MHYRKNHKQFIFNALIPQIYGLMKLKHPKVRDLQYLTIEVLTLIAPIFYQC